MLQKFGRLEEAVACVDEGSPDRLTVASYYVRLESLEALVMTKAARDAARDAVHLPVQKKEEAIRLVKTLRHYDLKEEMLVVAEKGLAMAAHESLFLYTKLDILRDLGRHEEALAVIDVRLTRQEENRRLLTKKASILLKVHRGEEALEIINQLVALEPDNPASSILQSRAWQVLGDHDKAEESLKEFLRRDPENARVSFHLARFEAERGDHEAAIERLHSVLTKQVDTRSLEFLHKLSSEGHGKQRYAQLYRALNEKGALNKVQQHQFDPAAKGSAVKRERDEEDRVNPPSPNIRQTNGGLRR